jgi:hypothetical protein
VRWWTSSGSTAPMRQVIIGSHSYSFCVIYITRMYTIASMVIHVAMKFAICAPSSGVADLLYRWKPYKRARTSTSKKMNGPISRHHITECPFQLLIEAGWGPVFWEPANSTPKRTFTCRIDLLLHAHTRLPIRARGPSNSP